MGEVYAGPGYRRCARPGCGWPAVAVLAYDYASRSSWIEEMGPRPDPATYELCALHTDRFSPPRGWELQDRRGAEPEAERPASDPIEHTEPVPQVEEEPASAAVAAEASAPEPAEEPGGSESTVFAEDQSARLFP